MIFTDTRVTMELQRHVIHAKGSNSWVEPKEQISMNMFMDICLLRKSKTGFDTYRELLIAHIRSDKDDFGYFAIENVSSQVLPLNGIYIIY